MGTRCPRGIHVPLLRLNPTDLSANIALWRRFFGKLMELIAQPVRYFHFFICIEVVHDHDVSGYGRGFVVFVKQVVCERKTGIFYKVDGGFNFYLSREIEGVFKVAFAGGEHRAFPVFEVVFSESDFVPEIDSGRLDVFKKGNIVDVAKVIQFAPIDVDLVVDMFFFSFQNASFLGFSRAFGGRSR